jgi:hypothetical protein
LLTQLSGGKEDERALSQCYGTVGSTDFSRSSWTRLSGWLCTSSCRARVVVVHFDCRLNCKEHIARKRNLLKNRRDQLVNGGGGIPSIYRKQVTHLHSGNQTYMELRNRTVGLRQKSNVVIMQRSQYTFLRAISNAPRYLANHTLHTDFNIRYVSDVTHERLNKHHIKLEAHPNPLLEPQQPVHNRRLKRCWPFDLQRT